MEAAAQAAPPLGANVPVVVLDVPLLVETGRSGLAGIVVVDTDTDTQVQRLVEHRGLTAADAGARIAAQATRDQRLQAADAVVDNSGDLDHLAREVDRVWAWILTVAPAGDSPAS
jgi:dephospho-CoA kinase